MNTFSSVRVLLIFAILVSGCAKKENISLVKNGKTSYVIYTDPQAPESVKQAAAELKNYFTKVTGASPEIVAADQIPSSPYISLGNTLASKSAGIDPSVIPNDGFQIVTRDKNLFILGPDTPTGEVNKLGGISHGTSNGIYTFIEDYLGVQWLMTGELGEHYKKINAFSIPELDTTEFSPFNYRVQSFRSTGPLEEEWDLRMKLAKVAAVSHSHAWAQTIPPSLYEKHPDWFAQVNGKHLPPSGTYKLETTNPELVQAYADTIIANFRRKPNLRWYSLSPADGSYDWSNSPASMALTEKDPFGNLSRTPLILKFYNDVAKIVGKEFPDHKLGGYIYAMYLYPPSAGLPKLEPNLALVVATSISYGYQLYRPSTQENWDNVMRTWGESAKKDGFDLYYYDLPTSIMQPNGILWPPAPDILNFIFSRLSKYGFKGAYVYGNPVWPVFGAANYVLAKLQWNPDQDAAVLLDNYYNNAYGDEAAPFIAKIYNVLDTSFRVYMNNHPRANYNLTSDHLKEIYGPSYQEIEGYYLQALDVKKDAKQQKRVELFGQVLSLMQWNLRSLELLPADYQSPLTLNDEEIDQLLSNQIDDGRITRSRRFRSEAPFKVVPATALPDAKSNKAVIVPVRGSMRMLLYTPQNGEVSIHIPSFDPKAEFIQYTLYSAEGKPMFSGAVRQGRTIRFNGEAGKSYFLDIPSRGALIKLEVDGAITAYKSDMVNGAFKIQDLEYEGTLAFYYYVPKEIKDFSVTLGEIGSQAEIFAPNGKKVGKLDCSSSTVSRVDFRENGSKAGFWKIEIPKFQGSFTITLDEKLPQWFIPDPAQPLMITSIE